MSPASVSNDFAAEVLRQLGAMNNKLDAIRDDISETKLEVSESTAAITQRVVAVETRLTAVETRVSQAEAKVATRASTDYAVKLDDRLQQVEKDSAVSGTKFNLISYIGGAISTGLVGIAIRAAFH